MVSSYYVTFRIASMTVGGKTYADRRQSLVENARAEQLGFWDETTSFIIAESELSTPDFTKRICKGLSANHDMVVVFDPVDMSANYFGALAEVDVLQSFLPKLKKLP